MKKNLAIMITIFIIASMCSTTVYASTVESNVAEGDVEDIVDLPEENSAYEESEIVEEAAEPLIEVAPTELTEEGAETVEAAEMDAIYSEDAEETVGAIYTVGNGVLASFYPADGRMVLFNSTSATGERCGATG